MIDDVAAAQRLAVERGEIFSVSNELRVALYGAVAAITAGVGMMVKANLEHIGPISLIAALALAAAGCYAMPVRARLRQEERSAAGEYLLLLGALIVSADLGYAEYQFHWLGPHWSAHLLILCVFHALTAYALDSRLVLSVSLTSLVAWFGVEEGGGLARTGMRELICAATIYAWREAHRRLGAVQQFQETFEHFAANLAFWGAIALCLGSEGRIAGVVCLAALAFVTIRNGLQSGREIFVIYGVAYTAVGLACLEAQLIRSPLLSTVTALVTVVGAVLLAWQLHRRLKAEAS